jgi:diguanylate cyclase (GGDEF)-like protein
MIIEDDRDIVALFRHVLDVQGFVTEIVLRGDKALERLDVITPDIVLLDLNLTEVPGPEILKKIRNTERLKHIPVIVVTGYANMAVGLESEIDLILLKPVSIDQLSNLIKRVCPVETVPLSDPPYDELTRLYTRSFFLSRLEYSIQHIQRLDGGVFGVLFFDYDGFSEVENRMGKGTADQILVQTAKFFRTVIRPYDTVSRFNADQFFIQIEDLPNKEILKTIASRITGKLSGYILDTCGIEINASIGMVYCGIEYFQADEIIRDANIALHIAKQTPDTSLVTFNPVKHAAYRSPNKFAALNRVS